MSARELRKFLFEGILDADVLDKLANIEDLEEDDILREDDSGSASAAQRNKAQLKRSASSLKEERKQSRPIEEKDEFESSESSSDEDDDNEIKSDRDFGISDDDERMGDQRKYSDQNISETTPQQVKRRVQFENQYQKIDLSQLYKTKNEIIYRLTEIYLPKSEQVKQKMVEYNKERMINQNEIETQVLRDKKRKIKEEIKQNKKKVKHMVKYANAGPLLDDIYYMYTPGMTTKQLDTIRDRGKYSNANHIAKILPSKRQFTQAQLDIQQRNMSQQIQDQKLQQQDNTIKSYLLEDDDTTASNTALIFDWDKEFEQPKLTPELQRLQDERNRYFQVQMKIIDQDLGLIDLSNQERQVLKSYMDKQAKEVVRSRYPVIQLKKTEKQCYIFMKNLNQEDFSYKGIKSAMQSIDSSGMFFDDFGAGSANSNHNTSHQIFTLANTDDRLSFTSEHSQPLNTEGQTTNKKNEEITDSQLQEWFIQQKYKIMQNCNIPIKRKKYWGEPKDCSSVEQIKRDNYKYQKFLNQRYLERGRKDEKIFKIEKEVVEQPISKNQKGKQLEQQQKLQQPEINPIKDMKEYEYFKKQQSYFYQDTEKKIDINSVMRNIQFELGMIPEEEFYQQEYLQDQVEMMTSNRKENLSNRQQEIEQRKERICNEFNDNFDTHFERRKKELHEGLMKKIQQHEKANQQSTQNQQTVAYTSGSHALLQFTEKDGSSKQKGLHRDDDSQENFDEEMANDEINQEKQTQKQLHDGFTDENMRQRVTKSKAHELNHAKSILKLTYNKFDWSEQDLMSYHRPNIQEVFEQLKYEQMLQAQQKNYNGNKQSFVFNQGILSIQERPDQEMPEQPSFVNIRMKVMTTDQIEKRARKVGIINAHDYFKDRFKLSIRDGKFCAFEHIDQNPLFVNNFGMASKLKRYVYSDKFLPASTFQKKSENAKHMGPHGAQILKKKGEKIPLLGQIDTKYYKGITVMENNMYYCPVFYHKTQRNDFLCVMHRDKNGRSQVIIRELSEIYTMGQEEPKIEVYNPQSRTYQHFIKRRTQAYVIRFLQENHGKISFPELNKFFPYINDQILKKIIKEINVEVDRNQICMLMQEYNDEQFRSLITPENICQYESAQFGEQMLKKVGIMEITNADKISYATNKFCSEEPDQKKQLIARIIEEEVLSTPWNLSQNFLHNKQTRGMMMLEGIGDPSNGHGGYSYLKLPLKISQDSLNKAKINRMYLNPAIQNPKAVTGTDADLRKLSKKEIKNKLLDLGFKEEKISGFTRWEMVALLRDKSSQAVSQGIEGDMKKFARGVRFTSKKQREMYQRQVNDIFKKQMNYLSKETNDFIPDISDTETRDQRQKKINDHQQMGNQYAKNVVELKEDIEIESIKNIPDYEILIMANQPIMPISQAPAQGMNIGGNSGSQSTMGYDMSSGYDREAAKVALQQKLKQNDITLKCTILRKKIKPLNGSTDKIERVLFTADSRQIKGFNKRKHKHEVKTKRTKKTSLKEKMQISKPILEDFKDRNRSETSSVINRPNQMMQSSSNMGGGEPVKIKIGGLNLDTRSVRDYQHQDSFTQHQQPTTINLSSLSKNKQSNYQRFQSQLNLSSLPFDQLSNEDYIPQDPIGGKITISMNPYQEDDDQQVRMERKKQQKPKKNISKFANAAYNDDDYESYKPKTQTSRRRQQNEETLLNDTFSSIIDSCLAYDQSKLFHYPVKKKDAPAYYNVIQNPIDLTMIKNKAKRQEYNCKQEFVDDIALLRGNAELFNGRESQIAVLARDLEQHALDKLQQVNSDITSLEMLVKEKRESGTRLI